MKIDLSHTEENYIKAVYALYAEDKKPVSTNKIAEKLKTKASSVTDMIKKLADKNLVKYVKYQGASLTSNGLNVAVLVIRKHRLWEVFLVETLGFHWDEVHEVAEQLEHVKSIKLIEALDAFLDFPSYDPHGDPIPDAQGNIPLRSTVLLSSLSPEDRTIVLGVKDNSSAFLKYLDHTGIHLGSKIRVIYKEDFDHSMLIDVEGRQISISQQIATNLYVKKIKKDDEN